MVLYELSLIDKYDKNYFFSTIFFIPQILHWIVLIGFCEENAKLASIILYR